jgi:pimeloyl-ACP methyl ester carboxylesterase
MSMFGTGADSAVPLKTASRVIVAGSPCIPEHVVGVPASQPDDHAGQLGCQLGGRDGGQGTAMTQWLWHGALLSCIRGGPAGDMRGWRGVAFDWGSNIELMWEHPQTERFLRRFASYGRLIFFDMRGIGLSDPVENLPPLEEWMDDVRTVMECGRL